ncbi:MAG TPA: hypothetical protein VEG65_04960 [Candidatus Bathyarchaeia archaeon]|nr:hypothetical protein [Candidatus Bathyarchaeia archaeon]
MKKIVFPPPQHSTEFASEREKSPKVAKGCEKMGMERVTSKRYNGQA